MYQAYVIKPSAIASVYGEICGNLSQSVYGAWGRTWHMHGNLLKNKKVVNFVFLHLMFHKLSTKSEVIQRVDREVKNVRI